MFLAYLIAASAPAGIDAESLRALAAADARLVAIGRRLAKGSAGLCAGAVSNPGWTIEDVEQFQPKLRKSVRKALGLAEGPTVVAVEPGSAAGQAGVMPGDQLIEVNGWAVPAAPAKRASRARQEALERATRLGLSSGAITVRADRSGKTLSFRIPAETGCASDFLIGRANGLRSAASNGAQVTVSAAIIDFAQSDDELALILAHEFAHNILGHNKGSPAQRIAGADRSGARGPDREREADRWALYLIARGGYDIAVAPGFWRRWGPKTSFGILSDGSHPSWRDRAERAEAEIGRIKAQQAAGQVPMP